MATTKSFNNGAKAAYMHTQSTDGNPEPIQSSDLKQGFTPTNYPGSPLAVSQLGAGGVIAEGVTKLSIGLHTVAAGNMLLIGFGTDEADARTHVSGTVASEAGHVLKFNADISAAATVGFVADLIHVPQGDGIDYYVIAENHATPTAKVMVSQGV